MHPIIGSSQFSVIDVDGEGGRVAYVKKTENKMCHKIAAILNPRVSSDTCRIGTYLAKIMCAVCVCVCTLYNVHLYVSHPQHIGSIYTANYGKSGSSRRRRKKCISLNLMCSLMFDMFAFNSHDAIPPKHMLNPFAVSVCVCVSVFFCLKCHYS